MSDYRLVVREEQSESYVNKAMGRLQKIVSQIAHRLFVLFLTEKHFAISGNFPCEQTMH